MLSGFSFRLAFVFSVNSLNLSGFPLTSFHLFEDNFVRRSILKNWKPLFRLPLIAKRCDVINVELKTHYLLFRDFMFLCGQSSKNITKYFFKKCFFRTHFAINLFYLPNLKMWTNYGTRTTLCIVNKRNQTKKKLRHCQKEDFLPIICY